MAYMCDNCSRGVQYGTSHTHGRGVAGGRWKKRAPHTRKVFKPNLHKWMGMKLCTKCLRLLKGSATAAKSTAATKVVATSGS